MTLLDEMRTLAYSTGTDTIYCVMGRPKEEAHDVSSVYFLYATAYSAEAACVRLRREIDAYVLALPVHLLGKGLPND